jgi:hypothetical protein
MAKFVQIIEYTTSRFEECQALGERFREAVLNDGGPKPIRVSVTRVRDIPDRYVSIVEFDSYETAMANSNRPETSEFAAAMSKLCDSPPVFHDLDVVEEFQP